MKKLLPLLLFAVVTMLVSCEKHEPASVKAQFENLKETLTVESDLTVKVQLNQPAEQDLSIPLEFSGDAELDKDYTLLDLDENNPVLKISKGQSEASFTVKHMERNGTTKEAFIAMRPGSAYALGDISICQLIVAPRETIYASFAAREVRGGEFSLVDITVELSHEDPSIPFEAPEDLQFPIMIVDQSEFPEATNVEFNNNSSEWVRTQADEDWDFSTSGNWEYNAYKEITIPMGGNTGTAQMFVTVANDDMARASDPQYRIAVTVESIRTIENMGYKLRGYDTTFVMIDRIEDPVREFLINKKLENPVLGYLQSYSTATSFSNLMRTAGDDISLLPSNTKPNDGLSFYSNNSGNNSTVEVSVETDSDFGLYFRQFGNVQFISYNSRTMPYLVSRAGRPVTGITLQMRGNREFYKDKTNIDDYLQVLFVPTIMTQADRSVPANHMDVIIPSYSYRRDNPEAQPHFFRALDNYGVDAHYYDVWYRFNVTAAE